ncbi:MAG: hydrogenase/urease maturation nickel metallochaperone HypA [Bryobacteraceae bacterium]
MHEMGIASSILEAAWIEARPYPGQRPSKVGVVIGEYAGVDTESLRFCFETLANGLELDITWHTGSDELKLAYLEFEEVTDEGGNRDQGSKRERSDCGAAA